MTNTKKETKQNLLLPSKIRKAAFVPVKYDKDRNFKYSLPQRINIKRSKIFINAKRSIKSIIQKPRLWLEHIDFQIVKRDIVQWFIEVIAEGITANFATHFLLHWEYNPMTIIAHGIVIKQGLSIYWRLRKDGSASKIPKKDE